VLGRADVLQLAKVAGASITPPATAVQPLGRPRHPYHPWVSGMIKREARRVGPRSLVVRRSIRRQAVDGLTLFLFAVVIVALIVAGYGRWFVARGFRDLPAKRIPGWVLPIAVPVFILLRLRFGRGNKMVTPGYYAFGAVLGVVVGLILWMAMRQKLASSKRRLEAWDVDKQEPSVDVDQVDAIELDPWPNERSPRR
jgi:hypothetical protein